MQRQFCSRHQYAKLKLGEFKMKNSFVFFYFCELLGFIHRKRVISSMIFILHTINISKVLFSQFENNKQL